MIAQLNSTYIRLRPGRLFPRLVSYFFFEGRPVTTSGRWFNPITFASLRRASRSAIDPATEKPVFITGTGRSGTTVLGMALSVHPEVGFLNEPKALWHHVHPGDDLIGNYTKTQGNFYLHPNDATAEQSNRVRAIYSSYIHLTGSSVILDKYPEMIFRTGYLKKLFRDPRFIFLHRNPWDTIRSTAIWSEEHGGADEDWWGVDKQKWKLLIDQVIPNDPALSSLLPVIRELTSQLDMSAVEWIATMNQALRSMEEYPDSFLKISYEELVNEPVPVLKRICSFIGIESDSKMLDYGSRMLKARHRTQPVVIHPSLMGPLEKTAAQLGYQV